mgnify:CR=1 FL=1
MNNDLVSWCHELFLKCFMRSKFFISMLTRSSQCGILHREKILGKTMGRSLQRKSRKSSDRIARFRIEWRDLFRQWCNRAYRKCIYVYVCSETERSIHFVDVSLMRNSSSVRHYRELSLFQEAFALNGIL